MFFDQATGQYEPVVSSSFVPAVVTNGGHTITITFDATSFPRLSSLQGSVFTIVISPLAVTQSATTTGAAASLALPSGSDLTTTRDVSFQASGVTIGLTPSEDAVRAAGRADLSGGGGDEEPSDDDLDMILRILGFTPPDPTPAVAPASAPPANNNNTAQPAAATGPGAWLPPTVPADVLFAAAAGEPFAFLPDPVEKVFLPQPSQDTLWLAEPPVRDSGAPCLLALPLLGAVALQPPVETRREKKPQRAGVVLAR
jgi:hypothetical protein